MLKLIVGVKGTGKTKTLIDMVNVALENTKGSVICIEKGKKLIYDVKYQARLIDTDEYLIKDSQSLFGFVSGIYASNRDVTDIFIDSALKICNNEIKAFEKMISEIYELSEKNSINFVITSSITNDDLPEDLKKYL